LAIGAPVAALQADPRGVSVEDITIVGTPTLYVERPADGAAPNVGAWVVFRTQPHLRVVGQVVVEVQGLRGHSHTGRGAPDCVRATVLAGGVLKPGSRYRVRFYGRSARAGKVEALLATRTLTAHRFRPAGRTSVPRCQP
jgi:hypothetical protein